MFKTGSELNLSPLFNEVGLVPQLFGLSLMQGRDQLVLHASEVAVLRNDLTDALPVLSSVASLVLGLELVVAEVSVE